MVNRYDFLSPMHGVLMPQLHLPRALYNLFVYLFRCNFSGIVGGSKLRHVFTFFTSTLQFLLATERDSPYRDLAESVTETSVIIMQTLIPVRCPCGFPTMISRAYDHVFGPNDSKILRCPHNQRVVPIRES